MNAVIEITHYGANVTYVREATVSPWLAAAHLSPAISRGSWVSLAVAAAAVELARSDVSAIRQRIRFWRDLWSTLHGPEVGFEEISPEGPASADIQLRHLV